MNVTSKKFGKSGELLSIRTNKFKKNILFMTYAFPISRETAAMDMLLPYVLFRGCEKYPSNADVVKRCEELYGASLEYFYSYFGNELKINICSEFVSDSVIGDDFEIIRGVAELISQIWLHPLLDEKGLLRDDEVRKAKNALCDSIRADDNDTAFYASRRCRELVCRCEPCGYSISVDDVMAITAQEITERYRYITENDMSRFFYVGDCGTDKIADILSVYFGNVDYKKFYIANQSVAIKRHDFVFEQKAFPVTQGKLSIGIYAGGVTLSDDDDYFASLMAVEIFGGSPISKLFVNVREKKSLCYYCSASYDKLKGIVYVAAGISPEKRKTVENEIKKQLVNMQKGKISEKELEAARMSLINSAAQISDRTYSMWSFCDSRTILGLNTDIDAHIEKIKKVNIDMIKKVTAGWQIVGEFFVDAKGGDSIED